MLKTYVDLQKYPPQLETADSVSFLSQIDLCSHILNAFLPSNISPGGIVHPFTVRVNRKSMSLSPIQNPFSLTKAPNLSELGSGQSSTHGISFRSSSLKHFWSTCCPSGHCHHYIVNNSCVIPSITCLLHSTSFARRELRVLALLLDLGQIPAVGGMKSGFWTLI